MIKVREVGKPTPGDHQILFRVLAATVNRTDCAILWGKPWIMRYFTVLWKPTCKITGTDFAGRVEAVGRHVSGWRIGDRVWGLKDLVCNHMPNKLHQTGIGTKQEVEEYLAALKEQYLRIFDEDKRISL